MTANERKAIWRWVADWAYLHGYKEKAMEFDDIADAIPSEN